MRWEISIERTCIYLYIIISMLAPNSGATSVKIIRVLVVSAILLSYLRKKKVQIPTKSDRFYLVWIIVFLLYCATGIFYAYSKTVATSFAPTFLYVYVVDFLVYFYVIRYMKDLNGFVSSMIIGSTLAALRCFAQYGLFVFMNARAAGGISGNTIGEFSAFASVLCIYRINCLKDRSFRQKPTIGWLILLVMNVSFMILSGSRKSILYFAIPFVISLLLNSRNPLKLFRNGMIAAVLVGIGYYLLMNVPALYSTLGYRVQSMINGFLGDGQSDASTLTRMRLIERGMNYFRAKPITGYGLGNFYVLNNQQTGSIYYSHNNYVELLVNCGLIGTAIYYSLHLVTLINAFRQRLRLPKEIKVFVGVMIAILVCDYGLVSYYDIYTQILTMVAVLAIYHPELFRKPDSHYLELFTGRKNSISCLWQPTHGQTIRKDEGTT